MVVQVSKIMAQAKIFRRLIWQKKHGVKKYDYLLYTKDVTSSYDKGEIWDEISIRKRTEEMTQEILKEW